MFTTMLIAEGVGLAANQVGVDLQGFVYDLTDADDVRHVGHVLNPRIEVIGPGDTAGPTLTEEMDEGCPSVPGPAAARLRSSEGRVHGPTIHGRALTHNA